MSSYSPRLRRFPRSLILCLCVFFTVAVAADGPVNTVPGVTVTSDNNDTEGETWGRAGGRTMVFSVGDVSAFQSLLYGATSAPSAAFDNNVNAPGETLTFSGSSNLAAGVAIWTGSAFIQTDPTQSLPPATVQTRFIMTVTSGGNPVALANFPSGPAPGLDVKSVGASFTVNMRFEAFGPAGYPFANTWAPFLTFYDAVPTVPGNPPDQGGPALTGFSRGFFFNNATTGMTIEEHDANVTSRLTALSGQVAAVKGDTAFLRIDTVGRLQGVSSDLGEVKHTTSQINSNLMQVQGRVDGLYNVVQNSIPPDLARRGDVERSKDSITDLLMILIGLKPCPDPSLCAQATLLADLARQSSVTQLQQHIADLRAAVAELPTAFTVPDQLELQVIELDDDDSSHKRRWLVRTSIKGVPVNVELANLTAVSAKKRRTAVTTDVTPLATSAQLMPGLMEVRLDVQKPKLFELAFHFSVRHTTASAQVLQASSVVGLVDER